MKNVSYLLLFLTSCIACEGDLFERSIQIDQNYVGQLALTAELCDCDTMHTIFLTKTIGVLATPNYLPIENASIVLATQGDQYVFVYNPITQFYEHPTNLPFGTGEQINLTVDAPSFKKQTITQTLPPNPTGVQIDTIGMLLRGTIGNNINDIRGGNMSIRFTDAPLVRNYYIIEVIGEGEGINLSTFTEGKLKAPLLVSSQNINVEYNSSRQLFINDQLFDGQTVEININYLAGLGWQEMEHIEVRLRSITREGYLYGLTTSKYNATTFNRFAEQVISFSNTKEGVGIFSVSRAVSKRF